MRGIFSNWRKQNLSKATLGKYFLYAIGEILLITIGVLIAVKINQSQENKRHVQLRCQYLEELNYTFDFDIKDIEENVSGLDSYWIPQIKEVLNAIEKKELAKLDSLEIKLNIISKFLWFGQRSKTKMEELKFSPVDLIGNRELKNKILLYQDEQIMFLKVIEKKYDALNEQIRKYYAENFVGYAYYNNVVPNDLVALEKDKLFFSLTYQKLIFSDWLNSTYKKILEEQYEIKKLIENEIEKNCV